MSLEIGKPARLIQPVIQGDIVDTEYDKDARELRHLVSYTDTVSGETHTRWFPESQLEAV